MGFLTDHPVILKPEYKDNAVALAVKRLLDKCNAHQGGGTWPINHFLLSLYNGGVWAPDMQLLCYRIDEADFDDVIVVMRGYAKWARELHTFFVDGDTLFESIAPRVRMRKLGGFCDDNWVLPLGEYLDAVVDYLAGDEGVARASAMVLRAQSGGFFNRHTEDERLRRRVCIASDAQAIREQAERDTDFLSRARNSLLEDGL